MGDPGVPPPGQLLGLAAALGHAERTLGAGNNDADTAGYRTRPCARADHHEKKNGLKNTLQAADLYKQYCFLDQDLNLRLSGRGFADAP